MGFGQSGDTRYHKDLYEYNPGNNTWIFKTNFPGGNRFIPIVFVINGKAYVGLGSSYSRWDGGQRDLWEYNPVTNSWVRKADFPGTRYGSANFVIDGKGYLVGGYGLPLDGISGSRRDCWQYDPQLNLWTQKADLPVVDEEEDPNGWYARRWDATGFAVNGKGYVGGGYNFYDSFDVRTDFWQYDPILDVWQQKGFFPSPQGGNGLLLATATEICGKVYIGLGLTDPNGVTATENTEFWQYDPITNIFLSIPPFGGGNNFLYGGISFSFNGKLFAGNPALYAYDVFSISGPSPICTSGTFTFVNPPAGATVSWSSSNPSGLSVNSITGAATRMNNFNGQVTLTATLNGACGATNFTKNVKVGNSPPIGISSVNSNCSGNSFNVLNTSLSSACTANTPIYFTYRITDPNYSNFVFTPVSVPSGATWSFSGGNLYMTVTTPPSQGSRSATIALSATGPCGPYNVSFTSTAVNYYSSFFSMSPNPSKENVTVSMENENLLNDGSQNLIYAIKITDPFGTPGESFEYKAGINSVKIPLQNFNSGLHILSVFDGKTWSSKQLLIQK